MTKRTPENSTNVRFYLRHEAAPAVLGLTLWAALVGLMQWTGAIERLGDDVRWLTAFACAVAALTYAVDAELRRALLKRRGLALAVGLAATLASFLSPVGMLAFSPAAVVCAAAVASFCGRPRLSSAVAASPGARPGAL